MIDALLAMVPEYGIYLLWVVVVLGCMAVPLPSALVVAIAGGFAASGDLVLWQVIAAAFAGYIVGDQLAFGIARRAGPSVMTRLKSAGKASDAAHRAEELVAKRGSLAVFLSRTVLSPLGPYVSYLSGAAGMAWRSFTLAAVSGAACWALGYALLGHTFADQIETLVSLVGNAIGALTFGLITIGSGIWLYRNWRRSHSG